MPKAVCVQVIDDDCFLAGVSVPPLVLCFEIGTRVISSCFMGFTHSWWSPNPGPSDIWGVRDLERIKLVAIDALFDLDVLLDMD